MRRAVIWLGVAALVALTVDTLGDLTQDRPDPMRARSRSDIVLEVRERNVHSSPLEAAQGLWAICQTTVHTAAVAPGVVAAGEGRFRVTLDPAVGEHSWRRLKGCLEDMTVDQVVARVVSKSDVAP
jgi:hypothetical protein